MDNVEFITFDLETTGLSPDFNRIVEVGAVRFRADGTELDRMEQLVDPRCAIPTDVTKIHGITDEMVRGQPPIEDVLPEFLEFLGHSETILLAYNAPFDVGFLSAAFSRCKAILPEHPVIDTLSLSRRMLPRLRNHRLETIARHLRIAESTDHRALGDALVVQSVFLKLLAQAPTITWYSIPAPAKPSTTTTTVAGATRSSLIISCKSTPSRRPRSKPASKATALPNSNSQTAASS